MPESARHCADCGAELHGEYCSHCGQRDVNLNAPLKELSKDLGEEIFSFDNRFLKSLPPFFLKPGFLTQEYIAGRRTRYISPFKLYFFLSFLFFFALAVLGDSSESTGQKNIAADSVLSVTGVDTLIRSTRSKISISAPRDSSTVKKIFGGRLNRGITKLKTNPDLFFDGLREHAPQVIFILLPIFALILKLLYIRSKAFYFKHLIFSFHFHAFVFLILLIIVLLEKTGIELVGDLSLLLVFVIPFYLYKGMRCVYQQGRGKTFVKFLMLGTVYFFLFWVVVLTAIMLFISFV
ncbi:MAG: DUF3667 domain-containing protein [Ignavibacteriales bacterium]|nr:DUF3667 domain-containing protein [Ignavibacteriales bacterium]